MISKMETKILDDLVYCPDSGAFLWRKSGKLAGSKTSEGYISIKVCGKAIFAHRIAWFILNKSWPVNFIDHINGDRSNNRIENLRECTHKQNHENRNISKPRLGKKKHLNILACIGLQEIKSGLLR